MRKFKIDFYESYHPFILMFQSKSWLGITKWMRVDTFATREEAKAFHEKIKDLPEYL